MSKTTILKMLETNAPLDRQINKFPKYSNKFYDSPYNNNFDEITANITQNEKQILTSNLTICKVIILGDVAVGKTSIVNRFCRKLFDTNYKSTIGVDFEVERFDILGIPFNLQIWDTAGQERFKSIAQSYYRGAHVIMITFDLTSSLTLSNCKNWLKEALNASSSKSSNPYIFLIGSKKDLLSTYAYKNMEMNAINVAKQLNAEYWTVSSKTGENIDKLFYRIAALTFNDFIAKEKFSLVKGKQALTIGSDLISFSKNSTKDNRIKGGTCNGNAKCLRN